MCVAWLQEKLIERNANRRDIRGRSFQKQTKNVSSSSWSKSAGRAVLDEQVHWGRLSSKDGEEIKQEVGLTNLEEVESER